MKSIAFNRAQVMCKVSFRTLCLSILFSQYKSPSKIEVNFSLGGASSFSNEKGDDETSSMERRAMKQCKKVILLKVRSIYGIEDRHDVITKDYE